MKGVEKIIRVNCNYNWFVIGLIVVVDKIYVGR